MSTETTQLMECDPNITNQMVQFEADDTKTIHKVPYDIIKISATISTMINDIDMPISELPVIPLSGVNERCLIDIIKFCTEHYHLPPVIPEPVSPAKARQPVKKQRVPKITFTPMEDKYKYIINDTMYAMYQLILAVNYLDIPPMYNFLCRLIAQSFEGKTPEQIREMYGLPDDIPEAEKLEIIEKYKHYE